MNKLKIKPKFWRDALWVYPSLMLILGMGFSIFMWRLSGGQPYWMGLSVIMNFLIQPIFFLLWIDNLANRVIFEEKQVVFKGFLWRKRIEYLNIRGVFFSDRENANLIYFNPKLNKNGYMKMFIWNYSINLVIDEIKKRTDVKIDGYPDKVNRANFYGKIWFLIIMALTMVFINIMFWKTPELKPQYKNIKVSNETK